MSWYRTGTVAVTASSTNVTGTGTLWLANAAAGEAFRGPDGKFYEIGVVVSNTQLTLIDAYLGSTASGQSYAIAPTQSYIRDLATEVAAVAEAYGDVADAVDASMVAFSASGVDVNGGTIDGTVIGGSSAAAGTFTTINASGNITLDNGAGPLAVFKLSGTQKGYVGIVSGNMRLDTAAGAYSELTYNGTQVVKVSANGLQTTGPVAIGTSAWPSTVFSRSGQRILVGGEGHLSLWNETAGAGTYSTFYLGSKHTTDSAAIAGACIRGGNETAGNYAGFLALCTHNSAGAVTEAMRINSTQNLFVGNTTQVAGAKMSFATAGAYIGLGSTYQVLIGEDVTNTAGFLGTFTNHDLIFRTNNTPKMRVEAGGVVRPANDNTQSIGSASYRWSTVYAGTGTINTSDGRTKQDLRGLAAHEIAAARQLAAEVGTYRFISAVQAKGAAARQHIGLTVQHAIEIMEAHDLDPMAYGFICYDAWAARVIEHPELSHEEDTGLLDADERPIVRKVVDAEAWTETIPAGDTFGFRSDELLLFIARGLAAGELDLEARVAALEGAQ